MGRRTSTRAAGAVIHGVLWVHAVLLLRPVATSAQALVGPEFQVNAYTYSTQDEPKVASDATGGFVVSWLSFAPGFGLYARRYDAAGTPVTAGEFPVNSSTTNGYFDSFVASDPSGRLLFVWQGFDGSYGGVFGRRFNESDTPTTPEFQVNAYTTGHQRTPVASFGGGGNSVVVWKDEVLDGQGGVFARRYDALGMPLGADFEVTDREAGSLSVASDASGGFVVVWSSGGDGSGSGIFGRRFDAAGAPLGSEFQVNTYTTENQAATSVASDSDGNFVVVWVGFGTSSDATIFGQRYDASGARRGAEFAVSSDSAFSRHYPAVAQAANGEFMVVWQSFQDGGYYGIFGRLYAASGLPRGPEFQVNTFTTDIQRRPAVAAGVNGRFVVVWSSDQQDGSGHGIFGQHISADPIFQDGFEAESFADRFDAEA